MKKTRIEQRTVDGVSSFYPQIQGLFKRWKYFKEYYPYYSRIIRFDSLEEANEFVKKYFHKSVVTVEIHEIK